MLKIKTVTVVGANGTMGANVSAIFASFGNATVYMVSRDKEKSKKAAIKAGKSVKADSIVNHLIPVDYSNLDECVKASDLVFESAAENLELKIELHTKIGKSLKEGAVACTGSSGLSITRLAECYPEETRSQFFGVHMFNPPYQLTLCELTASPYSDMAMYAELKEYLVDVGGNTCIDRGALSDTVLDDYAKVDNLCHIAHNAHIGKNAVVVACAEVSGSCKVGDNTWVGPNACIRDQRSVGSNTMIGMGSVVVKNIGDNEVWTGNPAKEFGRK